MQRLARELDERLRGGRIEQVWALPKNDVVLAIERRSGPRLWFSSEPEQPHLYLRDGPHTTPERPPGFAMAARNLLTGRRIAAVRALHGDRIVALTCDGDAPATLVFELIPRRATAFVLDGEGGIKAVWQPRRGRPGPGEGYAPPGPDTRLPARAVDASLWEALRAAPDADALVRGLLRSVAGMSALVAREIAWRHAQGTALREATAAEQTRATEAATAAQIYAPEALDGLSELPPAARFLIAPYPLHHLEATGATPVATFDSLRAAAAVFYPLRACLASLQAARAELSSTVELARARRQRARDAVESDAEDAGDPRRHRQWGDLLLAYPNARREGSAVHVPDPYAAAGEPAAVSIPVDPARSQVDNAQRYYNRARRAERSAARTARRRAQLQASIDELGRLLAATRHATELGTCLRLARAARSHGVTVAVERWLRPECTAAGEGSERADSPPSRPAVGPREAGGRATGPGIDTYTSSDGFEILVGRSARANERLTHKLAAPHDFWLHAEGPGSHVLIRNPGRAEAPPPDALREAASLAAHFSRARGATKVNVRWTQGRHVKKPRGAPTGQVIIRRSSTILAEPLPPDELFGDGSDAA